MPILKTRVNREKVVLLKDKGGLFGLSRGVGEVLNELETPVLVY